MRSARSTPAGEFPVKVHGAGSLLQAARDGDYDTAKKCLKTSVFKRGEDVNGRDDRDCTALHYATLHYTTLQHSALHHTTLHYTTLHYITSHDMT